MSRALRCGAYSTKPSARETRGLYTYARLFASMGCDLCLSERWAIWGAGVGELCCSFATDVVTAKQSSGMRRTTEGVCIVRWEGERKSHTPQKIMW